MNIKRITYFTIVFVMILSCLSACSDEELMVTDTPAVPENSEASAVSDEEIRSGEDVTEAGEVKEEEPETVRDLIDEELAGKHVRIRLDGSGKDVFSLARYGRCDYRYGPSIVLGKGGSVDAYFASPGDSRKEYDWITYMHSDNGGVTWGDEKVVLAPTPDTADYKSVCDPDVFFYDGYYYIGYTGTINTDGLCNNLFLARSKNPDGPFEKWDGKGWGKDPVPIVYYYGVDIGWGVGEPSFVVVDDKLYLYYTLDSFSDVFGWVRSTKVVTADLTDPDWPLALTYEGTCIYRNDCTDYNGYTYADSDSWDVAYLEESGKFIALTTNRRFKEDSCLLYYESDDGIIFERVSEVNTDVISGCHNCGLMSDGSGHIKKGDKTLIGYAYSGFENDSWGVWATRFAPVIIDYTDKIDNSQDGKDNLKQEIEIDGSLLASGPIMLLTDKLTYTGTIDRPVRIRYYLMNGYRDKSGISAAQINIEDYDPDILSVNEEGQLVPLHEGISTVRVEYNGLRRDIKVRILPDEYDSSEIKSFYPVCRRYDISIMEPVILKVRPLAVFEDYSIHELSGYEISAYEIKFRTSDSSVCRVSADGTLTPVSPGSAVITVSGENCRYTLDVYVTE